MAHYQGSLEDSIALAQALIRCQSITPQDDGALDIVEACVKELGFATHRLSFGAVGNLYARLGDGAPFLCFAGHTDVVPIGDDKGWNYPPFEGMIAQDRLYGRGASDMKGAIAAFLAACAIYLKDKKAPPKGSLGFLITGDEEAEAVDGTQKVLAWMAGHGEKIDDCLIGEPSNPLIIGEAIKIGRRGSINMDLTLYGKQGHAANPHLAANPIPAMAELLLMLDRHVLDQGTEHFMPSNLELTSIDVGNPARNVIPERCSAKFNIRYNDLHDAASLEKNVRNCAEQISAHKENITYQLSCHHNGDPFLTKPCAFLDLVRDVVHRITGRMPELATSGGTSDARFIKDYARVVEFGLTTQTIHQVNEWAALDDIRALTKIYHQIISHYFEN